MAPDPNWLFSSIAQSSAAIVAIVGGFVMSALLLLTSERSSIQARVEERERELSTLEGQLADLTTLRNQRRVEFAFEDNRTDILKMEPLPSAEQAAESFGLGDVPLDLFTSYWQPLVEPISRGRALIDAAMTRSQGSYFEFEQWAKSHRLVFDSQAEQEAAERHYYKHHHRRPVGDFYIDANVGLLADGGAWAVSRADQRRRELDRYREEADDLQRKIDLAKTDTGLLSERARNFRYPPHLERGLAVLVFFSLFGVLLPFLLMPQRVEEYTAWHKGVAIGGFLAGLGSVFGYVWHLMRQFGQHGRAPDQPSRPGWRERLRPRLATFIVLARRALARVPKRPLGPSSPMAPQ